MSLRTIVFLSVYWIFGLVLVKVLNCWVPFKLAIAIGMILCFLVSFVSKLKLSSILFLSVLECFLLYLDNVFSLHWISEVKQSDWIAVIGSGVIFSVPGILASVLLNKSKVF